MDARLGWALALVAIGAGYWAYGWPGVVLAFSVIVFWLLLQFSRAMRVMRMASQAPVGTVKSAVMMHSKLSKGMIMMDVIKITHSLGRAVSERPETFAWRDESGANVEIHFVAGRCTEWRLKRDDIAQSASSAQPS